jgi:hypothetical protein
MLALLSLLAVACAASQTTLVAWNASFSVMNDPVMGGISYSTFKVNEAEEYLEWTGLVRNVPSLKAPGFCLIQTKLTKFANVQGSNALIMTLRTTTPSYFGFKVSLAALTLNPQFKSFKANFNVSVGDQWTEVVIPWDKFSNDWSPYTGDCTTLDPTGKQHVCCTPSTPDVCIKSADLANIEQIEVWAEGYAGNFTLDLVSIGALYESNANDGNPVPGHDLVCKTARDLRFNVSNRLASTYLPLPTLPFETLAEAVCCDSYFVPYSEPIYFFNNTDIDLFNKMNASGETTFYDSACGVPLFIVPRNRTFSEFVADTIEHGWPSFRAAEVVSENVIIDSDKNVNSVCGTHLGSYIPDATGVPRYCIDLSCVSGLPGM